MGADLLRLGPSASIENEGRSEPGAEFPLRMDAATPKKGNISLPAAVAIGIGGMVGAGIFSILGVVAEAAGNAIWISFLIGGFVALLSAYSYSKLGVRYPTAGGAVQFLVQGYGDGIVSGSLNLFMWIGYVIALALYAAAFSAYFLAMFPVGGVEVGKMISVGIVLLFVAVNWIGAKSVGRSELIIVAIKLVILLLFAFAGIGYVKPALLTTSEWPPLSGMFFGAGILFIGYEGFGLIANAAADMSNPTKMLPRALYISVIAVIALYLLVSITVVGNLPLAQLAAARDYALAEAAKPFLGELGFKLVAIAALLSTASAINATLFGAANVCYMVAADGELPKRLSEPVRGRASQGLFVTAALVIVFLLFFDLAKVAMMGSAAFLIVYASVHGAHLRLTHETGAKPFVLWLAIATCLGMFVVLCIYIARTAPSALTAMGIVFAASLLGEIAYRKLTGRRFHFRWGPHHGPPQ